MDQPSGDMPEQSNGPTQQTQPEEQSIQAKYQEMYDASKNTSATPIDQVPVSRASEHSAAAQDHESHESSVNQVTKWTNTTQSSRSNEHFTRSIPHVDGDWRQRMGTPDYYPFFKRPETDAWEPADDQYLTDAYQQNKSYEEMSHHFDGSYFQRSPQHCENRVKELVGAGLIVLRL